MRFELTSPAQRASNRIISVTTTSPYAGYIFSSPTLARILVLIAAFALSESPFVMAKNVQSATCHVIYQHK